MRQQLKGHYQWIVLAFCLIDGIGWRLNISILPPLLPLIIQEFKMNYLEAGFLNTGTMVAYCLLQYPLGHIADRLGRRNIMVLGQIWSAAVCLLVGMAMGFNQLLVLLIILGVGNGMHFIPGAALISDVFPPQLRSKALSISFSSQAISMLLAPVLAVPLAEVYGWRMPFLVIGTVEILVALAFWYVVKEPRREPATVARAKRGIITYENTKLSVIAHLTGYSMAILNFIPAFLGRRFGIDLYQAGLVSTAASLSLIASSLSGFSGFAIAGLKARNTIMITGLLAFAVTASMALASDVVTVLVLLLLHGVMRSIMVPAILNYAVTITRPETRASEMGFINTLWVMGGVIGPSLIGLLTDMRGFDLAFLVLSTAPLLSIAITKTLPDND